MSAILEGGHDARLQIGEDIDLLLHIEEKHPGKLIRFISQIGIY